MTTDTVMDHGRVVDKLKAMADPARLRIVEALGANGLNVGEITAAIGSQSQPAVSSHLRVLRLSGVIEFQRQGKCNMYALTDQGRRLLVAVQSLAE